MTDDNKVTGKQVLEDCVTLAKDLGLYIVDLSRRIYQTLKNAFKSEDKDTPANATD